jgi:hypothetical protein
MGRLQGLPICDMGNVIKEFGRIVSDVFQGIWHVIHGSLHLLMVRNTSGFNQAAERCYDSGKRMATAYKSGWDEGMADFAKDAEKKPGGN